MTGGIVDELFPPRYNNYHCTECGLKFLTVDLALGETPTFMTCLATEGCGGKAVSMQYPARPQLFGIPFLIEWVKPDEDDLARLTHPGLQAYFARGGLMRRAVDTAPDWVRRLV